MAYRDDFDVAPRLVDSTAREFLTNALQKSHHIRVSYHGIIWNAGIFGLCFLVVAGFLYYRYTHKESVRDKQIKLIQDQEYVLSKIRYFQEQQRKIESSARMLPGSEITGLPSSSASASSSAIPLSF
jgi:hypothetical protein